MTQQQLRRQRRAVLVYLYLAFLFGGGLDGLLMGPARAEFHPDFTFRTSVLLSILFGLGAMWYCTIDARLVGKPLIQLAKLGIFVGWPIGVPIYLIWARGIRGLGLLLLHGSLLLLVRLGTSWIVGYLVYGEELLA